MLLARSCSLVLLFAAFAVDVAGVVFDVDEARVAYFFAAVFACRHLFFFLCPDDFHASSGGGVFFGEV